jgi:UDP-N-acetylmuramate dehydrogenase
MIQENIPLNTHSTMKLGGNARYYAEVNTVDELINAVEWADSHQQAMRIIGSGSNIVWADKGYDGLIIVNKLSGFEIIGDGTKVRIGAGEVWDDAVKQTVDLGLSGIEFLSLIPGTAGATPVQNVGAYGREISDVLVSIEAYDRQTKSLLTLLHVECHFSYRSSIFKEDATHRYIITSILLSLTHESPKPPFYESLQAYLDTHLIHEFTPQIIRDAVIAIRSSKLPDPKQVANNGSFFANPILPKDKVINLLVKYPNLPHWPSDENNEKIPAGWLIEQAGYKGFHDSETGMATWDKQALVLVNEHATTTEDLLRFKAKIVNAVQEKFDILLEQEPELI